MGRIEAEFAWNKSLVAFKKTINHRRFSKKGVLRTLNRNFALGIRLEHDRFLADGILLHTENIVGKFLS